jgi:hypothetical protein
MKLFIGYLPNSYLAEKIAWTFFYSKNKFTELIMYLVVKSYFYKLHFNYIKVVLLRDRPFNLKWGGMVFCFVQKKNFRTTQELKYLFLLSRKVRNFFPEFNIRIYDINSESDYFFFLHQNQNIFFSNIGNQNIFLEKKP